MSARCRPDCGASGCMSARWRPDCGASGCMSARCRPSGLANLARYSLDLQPMTPLLVGCERSLKPVTPLLSEISLKWSVVGRQWCRRLHECSVPTRQWCRRLHECSVPTRQWCQWLHNCSVPAQRSCLFGPLQAGSATNDTSVGWLCAVFETGGASVERNITEMGCRGPTAMPVDGDGTRPGFETTRRATHQRPGPTGVEGAGGTGGHGRASRRGTERSEVT